MTPIWSIGKLPWPGVEIRPVPASDNKSQVEFGWWNVALFPFFLDEIYFTQSKNRLHTPRATREGEQLFMFAVYEQSGNLQYGSQRITYVETGENK